MPTSRDFLLVIADRVALVWVLEQRRMAFPLHRRSDVAGLSSEDRLLLYTTRGCFHNPTRDRGRVIGTARSTTPVVDLDPPVIVAGRSFALGCKLRIEMLSGFAEGVELAPLVPQLSAFPDSASWSARMRRPLVPISTDDGDLLRRLLEPTTADAAWALETYRARVPGVAS